MARVLGGGDASCLVACVADGAGSAKHSDAGSAIACQTLVEKATAYFDEHGAFDSLDKNAVLAWLREARERISVAANNQECAVREFASTILAVFAGPARSCFLQIGDGAIIAGKHGAHGVVFWPQSGEYANSTNFLTGDAFEQHLEFVSAPGPLDNVAVLSDGLERLALAFDTRTAHPPFCEPLFTGLRSTDDLAKLGEDLRGFLDSEPVNSRSDDDKSLVLASRCEEDDRTG